MHTVSVSSIAKLCTAGSGILQTGRARYCLNSAYWISNTYWISNAMSEASMTFVGGSTSIAIGGAMAYSGSLTAA